MPLYSGDLGLKAGSRLKLWSANLDAAVVTWINMRGTFAYLGDSSIPEPSNETYFLGEVYPTSRGGLTFGMWNKATGVPGTAIAGSNRRTNAGSHLAGYAQIGPNSGSVAFRVDLPNGPGQYLLHAAVGSGLAAGTGDFRMRDGGLASVLIDKTTAAMAVNQWADASGQIRTSAGDWATNEVPVPFSATQSYVIFLYNTVAPTLMAAIGLQYVGPL